MRLARVDPILHVRHEFPVWTAYSRRVLSPMAGFPNRRLRCPIRHLRGIRSSPACLDPPCSTIPPERTPCQGSSPVGVPARSVSSSHLVQAPWGFPSPPASLFRNATAGGLRRTSTPKPWWVLRVACQDVKTVGIRNKLNFQAVAAHQGSRLPLRPTGLSVYAYPILYVGCLAPPRDQPSIRVGGPPLPDRNSHPARDAEPCQ